MSINLLEKAVNICKEVAEHSDYYGMDGYSEEENNEAILFIYEMLVSKGEAETLKWLVDNEFLESEEYDSEAN